MMRILPYRTTQKRIEGVVVTLTDITDIKNTKHQLEHQRDILETRVAERTEELQQANQSLTIEVGERREADVWRAKLLSQLVTGQELERRRMARELHDQLGQQLTGLRLKLESLKKSGERALEQQVEELLKITAQLDDDIEFLAWELRPVALDDLGLAAALRNYVNRWAGQSNVSAEFHTRGFENNRAKPEVENNLYRIAQEALNNVAKHSHASHVDVILEPRDNNAVLIIEDNGRGFDVAPAQSDGESMGLTSMRERAALLGGKIEIESTPEKGTSIFVTVPLSDAGGG
jgi:signal transduction histidine kinase